jgi:hypothetical protein
MTIPIHDTLTPGKAGLYKIPDADYYQEIGACINHSSLKLLKESPRKLRLQLDGLLERKARCLALGILAHYAVFEMTDEEVKSFLKLEPPFNLGESMVVCPDSIPGTEWQANCAAFKGSKAKGPGWKAEQENLGKEVFRINEFRTAIEKRKAFQAHQQLAKWIGAGATEVTAIWYDTETGQWCIGRLDWLTWSSGEKIIYIVDLKGVGQIDKVDSQYEWQAWYRQLGFYRDALRTILGDEWTIRVRIVAQDGEWPHDCQLLTPEDANLDFGLEEQRSLIRRFQVHQEFNFWPPPSDRVIRLKGAGGLTNAETRHHEDANRWMAQIRAHCEAQGLPIPATVEEMGINFGEVEQ